ncbi:alpha/beta hydrolase [Blastococcus saxobsidens]|uniref:Alpha/beta hydrolase n=2 Tax=Blastococcus saxobsidens TaxID=138336 RepID=A0A6L9W0C7_9ACTN|nr:alpha/beta hydrolase [Blastococcus saxobsidens]
MTEMTNADVLVEPQSSWTTPVRVGVELVELRRDDGLPIDALWYAADEPTVGMLHVHGKGSSVLTGPGRFLPPLLPGIAHLAVNMRCHDLGYTVGTDDWAVEGGMWEDLTTGHLDLAAGVAHLRERGVQQVVVCGHSSGGFYAADLMPRDPAIAAWILLSPLTTNKNPFALWWPDPADQARAADLARTMVAEGRGRDLIPVSGWYHAISAGSLVQRLEEPDGIWLSDLRQRTAPVLLAWGDAEPRDALWNELFAEFAGDGDQRLVLRGADHYYRGQEGELAAGIASFLELVGLRPGSYQRGPEA